MDVLELDYLHEREGGRRRRKRRERERLRLYIHKECDLTHIQQNLLVYIIKVGSLAYPKEGVWKGRLRKEKSFPIILYVFFI